MIRQPVTMKLKSDPKPKFYRARKVAIVLPDQIKQELDKLEPQGIIELVKPEKINFMNERLRCVEF